MARSRTLAGGRPLFLIGPPRSGTTLMTRILNAHRRILLTNETAVFMQLAEASRRSEIGRKEGIVYGKSHGTTWASVVREHAHALFDDFYTRLADAEDRQDLAYCGEKHPHLNIALEFVDALYPDAMYVYAIRDPRDSACSIAQMNEQPFGTALDVWGRFSAQYEAFVERLPNGQVVRLRYEDLIADYEGVAKWLVAQLGLEADGSLIRYVRDYAVADSHTKVAARASAAHDVEADALARVSRDFRSTSLERWRTELNEDDREMAASLQRDFLERYGYARA